MSATPAPRNPVETVAPKMAELAESLIWGDIWERPELSKRDRSLVTCAVLIALYRPIQLKGHFKRALENGLSREELGELITHVAIYAGWPSSVTAAQIADEVFSAD